MAGTGALLGLDSGTVVLPGPDVGTTAVSGLNVGIGAFSGLNLGIGALSWLNSWANSGTGALPGLKLRNWSPPWAKTQKLEPSLGLTWRQQPSLGLGLAWRQQPSLGLGLGLEPSHDSGLGLEPTVSSAAFSFSGQRPQSAEGLGAERLAGLTLEQSAIRD